MATSTLGSGTLVLAGTTSGTTTVTATAVAGTTTLTLPAATDTLVGKATTDTLTNKTLTSPVITGASVSSMASSVITSGTSQASTSGTSIDFTGIPSWVKRITVMFNGVSTNGTSNPLIQIGDSSGVAITGYSASSARVLATPSFTTYTTGFGIYGAAGTNVYNGVIMLNLVNLCLLMCNRIF